MPQIDEPMFKGLVLDLELFIKEKRSKITDAEFLRQLDMVLALKFFERYSYREVWEIVPAIKKERELQKRESSYYSKLADAILEQEIGEIDSLELNESVSYVIPEEALEYAESLKVSSGGKRANSETLHMLLGIISRPNGFFSKYVN
jgi:protein-tyrosine-phosphatase